MLGNARVQNPARSSLSDDGIRSWDEEIVEFLDNRYQGWRNPKETTMVPPVLPSKNDPGALAEKKIFDLLGQYGKRYKEAMFVIHAHQFSELRDEVPDLGADACAKKWLNGEHDFVLLSHKFGPIFMQVKACSTIKEYHKAEKQLRKDKQATRADLKKNFGSGKLRRESADALFNYPGFVVMPNCPKAKSSDRKGLFKEDCESIEAFVAWWETNVKMKTPTEGFTQEIYEHLVKRFVGCFDKLPFLSEGIDEMYNKLNFATREQWKVMRCTSPRQWITGPAGSGKTWLLQEKVVELARQSLIRDETINILVLCYHRPLAQHLESQFQIMLEDHLAQRNITDVRSIITVMTYDKFVNSNLGSTLELNDQKKKDLILKQYAILRDKGVPPHTQIYQHIFVDEGQDLYGIRWPEILELFLEKYEDDDESLEPDHYLWVMFDSNQTVQPSADNFQCFKKYLRKSSRLTQVLRNTGKIFDVSRQYYHSELCQDIELGHHVTGLDVKWDDSLPDAIDKKLDRGSAVVAQHIHELQKEKVQLNDMCVLSTEVETRNSLSRELCKRGIACQDAEHYITKGEECVIVESIRRFKGLESKVVILFDPTTTKTRGQMKELLYSAITRCSCLLVIVSTKSGCELIRPTTKKLSTPSRKRALEETTKLTEGKRPAFKSK